MNILNFIDYLAESNFTIDNDKLYRLTAHITIIFGPFKNKMKFIIGWNKPGMNTNLKDTIIITDEKEKDFRIDYNFQTKEFTLYSMSSSGKPILWKKTKVEKDVQDFFTELYENGGDRFACYLKMPFSIIYKEIKRFGKTSLKNESDMGYYYKIIDLM